MKTTTYQLSCVLLGAAIVVGCDTNISSSLDDPLESGSADFSNFVVVGDSLSAGYADAALYRDGQQNSYPSILADAFAATIAEEAEGDDAAARVGGYVFEQPLMTPENATGSLTIANNPIAGFGDRLVLNDDGMGSFVPLPIVPAQSTEIGIPLTGTFNNVSVPGARFWQAGLPAYGDAAGLGVSANPYFVRFASSTLASMMSDATAQNPTFFILWLGANDVLGYATAGGTGVYQDGNPPPYASNDITDPGFFENGAGPLPSYAEAVALLKGGDGKGVVINIPDVASIPFFTTVPYNAIPLDEATAMTLNAQVADGYNGALDAAVGLMLITAEEADRRRLNYQEGQNPILISDETLTDLSPVLMGTLLAGLIQARPATPDDFIVLTASSKLGEETTPGNPLTNQGVTLPLEDGDVLTGVNGKTGLLAGSEYANVLDATARFNSTIEAAADADPDIALYDASARLQVLAEEGISWGSGGVTSDFVTGGAFSLDGVHPTQRGYALIANEVRQLIEETFGANLPPIDPGQYPTVFYQQ